MISIIAFGLFSFRGSGLELLGPSNGVLTGGQRSTVHVVQTPRWNLAKRALIKSGMFEPR